MALRGIGLPLEIVEHIQSFMSYKEATRSSCVCRRLYVSWYQRPDVDFDESSFTTRPRFRLVSMRTVARYEAAKLYLNRFTIRLVSTIVWNHFSAKLLECTAKLRAFEINIILTNSSIAYRIPLGVFNSPYLVKLSVEGGALCLTGSEGLPVVCPSLKFLSLLPQCSINISNDMLNNYVMRCPNIEVLECRGHLLSFDIDRLGGCLHKLHSLIVHTLTYQDRLWLHVFIKRLPCLRNLTVRGLYNCHALHIDSPTIERLTIEDRIRRVHATLNLPKLRSLTFEGLACTSVDFQSDIQGVVAFVNIVSCRPTDNWFRGLHALLNGLKYSHIYLSVLILHTETLEWVDADNDFVAVPVEILEFSSVVPDLSLLYGLYRVCTPKLFQYGLV